MSTITKNARIIRQSKNLRGLLDYARVSRVTRVELAPFAQVNGSLRVFYEDGSIGRENFASYRIMVDWVRNRRSWRGAEIFYYGGDVGYLTKPGVIAGP